MFIIIIIIFYKTKGLFWYNLFLLKTKYTVIKSFLNVQIVPWDLFLIVEKWSLWDPWTVHGCTVYGRIVNSCGLKKKKKKMKRVVKRRRTNKSDPNTH